MVDTRHYSPGWTGVAGEALFWAKLSYAITSFIQSLKSGVVYVVCIESKLDSFLHFLANFNSFSPSARPLLQLFRCPCTNPVVSSFIVLCLKQDFPQLKFHLCFISLLGSITLPTRWCIRMVNQSWISTLGSILNRPCCGRQFPAHSYLPFLRFISPPWCLVGGYQETAFHELAWISPWSCHVWSISKKDNSSNGGNGSCFFGGR